MQGLRAYVRTHLPKYLTVGGSCAVLNALVTTIMAFNVSLPTASAIAFTVAGIVAFTGNYFWTYRDRAKPPLWVGAVRFAFAIVVLGWIFNRMIAAGVLHFLVTYDGLLGGILADPVISKACAYLIAMGLTLPFSATYNHQVTYNATMTLRKIARMFIRTDDNQE